MVRFLARAAVLISLLALPATGAAQLDFAGAVSLKVRTYPVKLQNGKPVSGPDGMPQAEALQKGQPANLIELPAVPVDENFPGGSILDALRSYQKEDPMAALAALQALLKNGYTELEIEKTCQIDSVKLQYEHKPSHGFPAVGEAGLGAMMQLVLDGVKAAELARGEDRLTARYNSGLSTDGKRDQETIALLRSLRFAVALRYNPRVQAPGLESLPPQEAKERFKAEIAKGKPVEGDVHFGPLHLAVKAKLARSAKKPAPPGCK